MKHKAMPTKSILVTGAAGFIGKHLVDQLTVFGHKVVGIDNLNDYYSIDLKRDRVKDSLSMSKGNYSFQRLNINDATELYKCFEDHQFDVVVNLAAQAGVRYSIENPGAYVSSNLVGMGNVLEASRKYNIEHLVYASSSSVYGGSLSTPFREEHTTDNPVSFYAATKKANEVMAASYSHLYKMRMTGLRFFTVYGPWGRPDMAPWLFTEAILQGKPIKVFREGTLLRDFTYVSDIISGICSLTFADLSTNKRGLHEIYNIGNNVPCTVNELIANIEKICGKRADKIFLEMQPGDVPVTCASLEKISAAVGFKASTTLQEGVLKFVNWYRQYAQL